MVRMDDKCGKCARTYNHFSECPVVCNGDDVGFLPIIMQEYAGSNLNNCSYDANGLVMVAGVGADSSKVKTGTTEEAKHYQTGKQQPIEIMQQVLNPEQFAGFLLGNVIKYSLRMNHKGRYREDAGKCKQYVEWLVDALDGKVIVPGGKT